MLHHLCGPASYSEYPQHRFATATDPEKSCRALRLFDPYLQSQNISVERDRALQISDNDVSLEYAFDWNHGPQPSFQDWLQRLDLAVVVLPSAK